MRPITIDTPPDEALLRDHLAELVKAAADLAHTLPVAYACQWRRPPSPSDDTGRHASGDHSDPTGDTAIDTQRLRMRAAVLAAERSLVDATRAIRQAKDEVTRHADKWGD